MNNIYTAWNSVNGERVSIIPVGSFSGYAWRDAQGRAHKLYHCAAQELDSGGGETYTLALGAPGGPWLSIPGADSVERV